MAALIREVHGTESEGFGALSEVERFCGRSFAALADDIRDRDNRSTSGKHEAA